MQALQLPHTGFFWQMWVMIFRFLQKLFREKLPSKLLIFALSF